MKIYFPQLLGVVEESKGYPTIFHFVVLVTVGQQCQQDYNNTGGMSTVIQADKNAKHHWKMPYYKIV